MRQLNAKCNKALTQQVLKAVIDTRSSLVAEICNDAPSGDKFSQTFESAKCIKDNAFESMRAAESQVVLNTQALLDANIADEKEKLKRVCCNVLAAKKLFLDASAATCGQFRAQYAEYVDSYSSESLGLICADIDKLAEAGECAKLGALSTSNAKLRSVSFLVPMLKLVRTLEH